MERRSGAVRRIAAAVTALLLALAVERAVCAPRSAALAAVKAEISLHDFDAAAAALERLAGEGDPEAEYLLGVFYLQGLDGPANPTLARQWLEKAATQGQARAAFTLAALLLKTTPRERAAAQRWLRRAHELGYRPAQALVHRSDRSPPPEDPTLAEQALRRAAERGDLAAV